MADDSQALVINGSVSDGELVEVPAGDALPRAIAENNQKIKQLHLEVMRRELAVQRAIDEQKLLQELQTLDEMTLAKMQKADPNRRNRMQISAESLERIVALQDELKLASKEEERLENERLFVSNDADQIENAIHDAVDNLNAAQENTGYTGEGGRPYEDLENVLRKHQLELAELEDEQRLIKWTTSQLTAQIESLTAKLEQLKHVDDEQDGLQTMTDGKYKEITAELQANTDSLASLKRILAKKEKVLNDIDHRDLMKELKKHEGDKRVLHSDLSKQVELIRVNQRAILANDDRMRKLEARLLELEKVLPALFAAEDEEGLSIGKPPEVPDTETVSVGLFQDAINDLQQQRETLAARDNKLEELDAAVEVLERKIDIMHTAQESQTTKAANEIAELDRERMRLEEHVDQIAREFSAERKRLLSSRKGLV